MKKLMALLMVATMAFSLCACETEEEKARRRIREATEAYEKAQADVAETQAKRDFIQSLIDLYE